jgi:hypothetical protein
MCPHDSDFLIIFHMDMNKDRCCGTAPWVAG